MWIMIAAVTLLFVCFACVYLASRCLKFQVIKKITGEENRKKILVGAFGILIIAAGLGARLGRINLMMVLIHLLFFWLICDGAAWLIQKKRKEPAKRYYAGMLAILLCAGWIVYAYSSAHHVKPTRYELTTSKQIGKLRIIQFSDSHIGTLFSGKELEKYIESMNRENPDLIVITGDFIDDDTSKEDMLDACKALEACRTKYGVFFVWGNHDKGYYASRRGYGGEALKQALEENGVKVLEDEQVMIGEKIAILGRKDRSDAGRDTMHELAASLDYGRYNIVLDHQPNDYDAEAQANVDLVLSGHTHGGQLFPFNKAGEWIHVNDATYGLEKRGYTNFIVSSGIADWAMDFKTGCVSEYVVIDVKEEQNE